MSANTTKAVFSAASAETVSSLNDRVIAESGVSFKKAEVVRLIMGGIKELGFEDVFSLLERRSGCKLTSAEVEALDAAIVEGNWEQAENTLSMLQDHISDIRRAKFILTECSFKELIAKGLTLEALELLQSPAVEMSGCADLERETLAGLLVCNGEDDLGRVCNWKGIVEERQTAISNIRELLDPSLFVPQGRLVNLLAQGICSQSNRPLETTDVYPLLHERQTNIPTAPSKHIASLKGHTNEVWFVAFDPTGRYLASAGRDCSVRLWDMESVLPSFQCNQNADSQGQNVPALSDEPFGHGQVLTIHEDAVVFISWNADGKQLLSCGNDKLIKLSCVNDGEQSSPEANKTFRGHTFPVTCCAWMPDGRRFVSGSVDRKIILWDATTGSQTRHWNLFRCTDIGVTVSSSGMLIALITPEKKLYTFSPDAPDENVHPVLELSNVASMTMTGDGKFSCINTAPAASEDSTTGNSSSNAKVILWSWASKSIVSEFEGHQQNRFIIRSAVGAGAAGPQTFVASGSEDSCVYVWGMRDGQLLQTLQAHTGTVNAVAWSPYLGKGGLLASASDDYTVGLWA